MKSQQRLEPIQVALQRVRSTTPLDEVIIALDRVRSLQRLGQNRERDSLGLQLSQHRRVHNAVQVAVEFYLGDSFGPLTLGHHSVGTCHSISRSRGKIGRGTRLNGSTSSRRSVKPGLRAM